MPDLNLNPKKNQEKRPQAEKIFHFMENIHLFSYKSQ